MIDYRSVHLRSHLSSTYSGEKSFDVVFDTVGSARLYRASPHFLKPAGFFGSIGGPGGSVWECAKFGRGMAYTALPAFLGGTPRTFSFVLVPQEIWASSAGEAAGFPFWRTLIKLATGDCAASRVGAGLERCAAFPDGERDVGA